MKPKGKKPTGDFNTVQSYEVTFGDINSPMSILPMMEDKGFKKDGFCKFHYWNNNGSKCLRCGLEVTVEKTGDLVSIEYSMTIPMRTEK